MSFKSQRCSTGNMAVNDIVLVDVSLMDAFGEVNGIQQSLLLSKDKVSPKISEINNSFIVELNETLKQVERVITGIKNSPNITSINKNGQGSQINAVHKNNDIMAWYEPQMNVVNNHVNTMD